MYDATYTPLPQYRPFEEQKDAYLPYEMYTPKTPPMVAPQPLQNISQCYTCEHPYAIPSITTLIAVAGIAIVIATIYAMSKKK